MGKVRSGITYRDALINGLSKTHKSESSSLTLNLDEINEKHKLSTL